VEERQKKEGLAEARVLVTKNPCSHPGDIRLLTPVSLTELMNRVRALFPKKVQPGQEEKGRQLLRTQCDAINDKFFVQLQYSDEETKTAADVEDLLYKNNQKISTYYRRVVNTIMFSTEGDRPD